MSMKIFSGIVLVLILCVSVMIAGCTSQTTTPAAATCPTATPCSCPGVVTATPTVALTTEPTQAMPAKIAVTVNVDQKDYTGKIPVTFGGGEGQAAVKNIEVILTRDDGSTATATLLPNLGESVTLQGTEVRGSATAGTDRVQVYVHMFSGDTYKVADVLRSDRDRA